MNIFLSWSGETSHDLAEAFSKWLPSVIQAVTPYFSPSDIEKGSRWSQDVASNLETSSVGLFFITKSNLHSDWMLFEAGAISRSVENSRVIPILFGIGPTDLSGPLVQFQSAKFDRAEIFKVLVVINSSLENGRLDDDVLQNVFEKWWDNIESEVKCILKGNKYGSTPEEQIRTDRDLLEELVESTREIRNDARYGPSHGYSEKEHLDIYGKPKSQMVFEALVAMNHRLQSSIDRMRDTDNADHDASSFRGSCGSYVKMISPRTHELDEFVSSELVTLRSTIDLFDEEFHRCCDLVCP